MYRKFKKFSKFKEKEASTLGYMKQEDASKPIKSDEVKTDYVEKSNGHMRRAFYDSIAVKADPYSETIPGSVPYAWINGINTTVSAKYGEKSNVFGNVLEQVISNPDSKLLDQFDAAKMALSINYLYLPTLEVGGMNQITAIADQYKRTITDAISKSYSETFIQLPFFEYLITNTGIVGVDTDHMEGAVRHVATPADLLLGTAVHYQDVLQAVAGAFNKMNQLRSARTLAGNMSWNREYPKVTSFWGLLNKAAFISQWEGVAKGLLGEYFDNDWYIQTNRLAALLSRKSDSIVDPVLEIDGRTNITALRLQNSLSEGAIIYYDSEHTVYTRIGTNDQGQAIYEPCTLREVLERIHDNISFTNVMSMIRSNENERAYFNHIVWLMDSLSSHIVYFKQHFGAFRTVLDVMGRVGINGWKKNPELHIIKDENYKPQNDLLVSDIFRSYFSSGTNIVFDDITLRWRFYTTFDKYLGTPDYDTKQGGAFLTFCTKDIVRSEVYNNPDNTIYLIPRMFRVRDNADGIVVNYALNRRGHTVALNYVDLTAQQLVDNTVLSRLTLLPQLNPNISLTILDLNTALEGSDLTGDEISAVNQFADNLFKIYVSRCQFTVDEHTYAVPEYHLSSDILGLIDVEEEGLSNNMITYIAIHCPFRTVTPIAKDPIGFKA